MVFSTYEQQRILVHYSCGCKAPTIAKLLLKENLQASRVGIVKFLKMFKEMGCYSEASWGWPTFKISTKIKRTAEEQMQVNDEMTAAQLHVHVHMIWTDECSVQMESHHRFCCR